jgi:hypothetical protein
MISPQDERPSLDQGALRAWLKALGREHITIVVNDGAVRDFGERFVPGHERPSAVDFLLHSPFKE